MPVEAGIDGRGLLVQLRSPPRNADGDAPRLDLRWIRGRDRRGQLGGAFLRNEQLQAERLKRADDVVEAAERRGPWRKAQALPPGRARQLAVFHDEQLVQMFVQHIEPLGQRRDE